MEERWEDHLVEKKSANHITYAYLIVTKEGTVFCMTNETCPYDFSVALTNGEQIVGARKIDWGAPNE